MSALPRTADIRAIVTAHCGDDAQYEVRWCSDCGHWHYVENAHVSVRQIQCVVAGYFLMSPSDLTNTRGSLRYWAPRQIAYLLAYEMSTNNLSQIGRLFGGRDHTTIAHGIRRARQMIAEGPMARTYADLKMRLGAE